MIHDFMDNKFLGVHGEFQNHSTALCFSSLRVHLKSLHILLFFSLICIIFPICRRRHKHDCLCAICVLKRRKREREENARIAQGQTGVVETQEPNQEVH